MLFGTFLRLLLSSCCGVAAHIVLWLIGVRCLKLVLVPHMEHMRLFNYLYRVKMFCHMLT